MERELIYQRVQSDCCSTWWCALHVWPYFQKHRILQEKLLSYRGAKLRNTLPTVTIIKAKPFLEVYYEIFAQPRSPGHFLSFVYICNWICNFCHIIYFDILLHARLYWKPILCNSVLRPEKSLSVCVCIGVLLIFITSKHLTSSMQNISHWF